MVEAGINQRKTPTTRPSSPARIPVTTLYEYDDAGNLIKTTDAKGQVMRYVYDGVNRIIAEYYGEDPVLHDFKVIDCKRQSKPSPMVIIQKLK